MDENMPNSQTATDVSEQDISDALSSATSVVTEKASEAVEAARDASRKGFSAISDFIEEKPLESVAIAFLAGLAIQRLLR
jgi:ElaB/YqjD/DUF883 family membrane-anchored ribosome-binding protein